EFLYAYMPLSDLGDYDGNFFLNQVRYSFKARDYFTWGKTIPEDIFRHFVLVYRVNNENLDSGRMVFFEELKDRVKDMSMYDAALEVNHWCHEKVTYRPSDGRTSAPLATIRTGFGRCGEESTFTVTAMRSVGIPARQCYTPRWAHTDNNHAWVEVWVDGQWYYLGACEPDAELNMGWFDIPATRTMMVHSNAYGKYHGKEEVNYQTDLFSTVNMLPNYTENKKIEITVVDGENNPIADATVKFKLYNHAEFFTIATQHTNNEGKARLTTGYGDLLIWAFKDGYYAYDQIKVREQDGLTLTIDPANQKHHDYSVDYDMNPPAAKAVTSKATKEKIELTDKRKQYEDSLRNAYLATFMTEEQARSIKNDNLTSDQIWAIIKKSEGNYAEVIKLMNLFAEKNEALLLNEFFASMSDKDHRDGNAAILQQHVTLFDPANYPKEVYLKGIISPRIANEGIRPWRNYLADKMPNVLNNDITPAAVMDWIENNIIVDEDGNYHNCPVTPRGVFELRRADQRSIDIFFVAACRSLNIPSYKDLATGQLYAYENGEWNKYPIREEQVKGAVGTLVLTYKGDMETAPKYGYQYTIAKEENGDFKTFEYRYDEEMSSFPVTLELEPGYYLLTLGNRYFDGDVLSRLEFFNIAAYQTVTKDVTPRPLEPRDMNYGSIDMNYQLDLNGTQKNISDLTNGKALIVCFIDPSREPTTHLLRDIGEYKQQFDKWGGNMLFVIPSEKETSSFNPQKWNLPKTATIFVDQESAWMNNIFKSTNQLEFKDNYPAVYIIEPNGKVIFKSEGYRIGTGELLYKSLK
ncbi:redoxin domain-containing protein, partial [Bacteroidales bacterium OttesenSCG-928-E04]|nr:redoxin domain-containing protein [Bacteroidales bacterium OttesenSCG-928-E04]